LASDFTIANACACSILITSLPRKSRKGINA
jgi:hypothetical protein